MNKLNIAVLFGGRSTEHEISIISGIQVLNALNKEKYNVLPIYITKKGEWIVGDNSFFDPKTFRDIEKIESMKKSSLMPDPTSPYTIEKPGAFTVFKSMIKDPIDILFPVFHGRHGEDGSVQGLFELMNIPYVGCDVRSSAISMDKVLSKTIARSVDVPVMKDCWVDKYEWEDDTKSVIKKIKTKLNFPVFVKPVNLGSSIGVTHVTNEKELINALNVCFYYDSKAIIEESLENAREINISVIGVPGNYECSVCEEPIKSSSVLSFEDKYIGESGKSKGMASLKRIVPAKVKKDVIERVEKYSKDFFREIGGSGICRIDYLMSNDEKKVYFNEINPMPGSLSFYLWKESGVSFTKLLDKLIDYAIVKHKAKQKLTTTFSNNALSGFASGGSKGAKA